MADSQRNRATSNDRRKTGMALESMAKVVQFNQRDLPDVLSEQEMHTHTGKRPGGR